MDLLIINFSIFLSLYISSAEFTHHVVNNFLELFGFSIFCISIFLLSGVYKSVLRFINFSTISLLFRSILIVFFLTLFYRAALDYFEDPRIGSLILIISLEGWIIGFLSSVSLIVGIRIFANHFLTERFIGKRVVIYGAGSAGRQLSGALKLSSEMEPIAFLDRNKALQDTYIGGLKVLKPEKLRHLVKRKKVDEVLIAIPSASKSSLTEMLKEIEDYSVKVRILPGLADLAQGKVLVSELKEVEITDLLGRFEVEANKKLLDKNIKDKVVLITGAGGSIGSEISRQAAKREPRKLILVDSNEFALYVIKNEIQQLIPELELHSIMGSVINKNRMVQVCKAFDVNTIYHSAAYKHVPLVEENPFEGLSNNVLGTKFTLEAAIDAKVETFVLISTDKAVRPTNIMGATKRFAELILQAYSAADIGIKTRMTMVRFGNVLGSSGSAIPLFQKQIKAGGPVTVTHPDVIRYFMSIPEAAELVIQAGAMGEGGDVFVLDMGEPVKIIEMAEKLINLNGLQVKNDQNPKGDVEIVFTGLRPGEKLYEELLIGSNVSKTDHKRILKANEDFLELNELENYLEILKDAEKHENVFKLREILQKVVPGFTPDKEIVDVVHLQKNNQAT